MSISAFYSRTMSAISLRTHKKLLKEINAFAAWASALTDEALQAEFLALRTATLTVRTPRGFALVREAALRAIGLRPFDVQMLGGLILFDNKLAEMGTGEGKTLTIVAPAALHALTGKGVHVVTANSYLAERDAALMAPVYSFLGLTVAALSPEDTLAARQEKYKADVTYGVGHDFGFDYLKDNLATDFNTRVQREPYAAIVDEVDSILIDEARVPLIISKSGPDVQALTYAIDAAVAPLKSGADYLINLKEHSASLTEQGYDQVETSLVSGNILPSPKALYLEENLGTLKRVHSAVKAYAFFKQGRDYVIESDDIVLVDQSTGRKMPGRRFEDGLHEALEAKERLKVRPGTVTQATITYQNYFRRYSNLAGLSGTALTDADEFAELYSLTTVAVPTNQPSKRRMAEDRVFVTRADKFVEAAAEVQRRHAHGQPVLVGCGSIREAEAFHALLTQKGLTPALLTAKHLAKEAEIIANAGRLGAITVSTNMAGRGTDISLGGEKPDALENPQALADWGAERQKVIELGGLFVLGLERNGLRRVDNQLAGRCARQGDPGTVQFYMSLDDELLGVFGKSRELGWVKKLVADKGAALEGRHVCALVTKAQKAAENAGFEARKSLMKFDSVISAQREAIYDTRNDIATGQIHEFAQSATLEGAWRWLETYAGGNPPDTWDLATLKKDFLAEFGLSLPVIRWVHKEALTLEEMQEPFKEFIIAAMAKASNDEDYIRHSALALLDDLWAEHLTALDELQRGASLRGLSGQNPAFGFSKDAFNLFEALHGGFVTGIARRLLNVKFVEERNAQITAASAKKLALAKVEAALDTRWVSRNEACPCGSGSKYRSCHGRLSA